MNVEPNMDSLVRTIGDPTRIRMLTLLMEGRALTAKELACGVQIEPSTATSHLRRLLEDQLIAVTIHGRHKYFRLASPKVAQLIETLMGMAVPPVTDLNAKPIPPIQIARFCYDYLAGKLGLGMMEALMTQNQLCVSGQKISVTPPGEYWFRSFGIDLDELRKNRRQFAYPCLDWSERKEHLAGALGAALAQRMLNLWLGQEQAHTCHPDNR